MTDRWARSGRLVALAVVIGVLASFGCGGSGGGGGGPTAPPPVPSGVSYTPDSPASPNSVYLSSGQGGSASVWVLDVNAQGVSDLYSVSFVLEYPTNVLDFRRDSESEGTFLSNGGTVDTELVVTERNAGEVTIGISRIGLEPGAGGSGRLLSIEFTTRGSGGGSLTMNEAVALDSLGVVQDGLTFISGSVNVRAN